MLRDNGGSHIGGGPGRWGGRVSSDLVYMLLCHPNMPVLSYVHVLRHWRAVWEKRSRQRL